MNRLSSHPGTADAGQFGALCNLFHALACDKADLTAGQIGDIVYYRASPVVCDESRTLARAVMAYLGLSFADSIQPVHKPGTGCRFADEQGNCEFHDNRGASELVNEVKAAMLNGRGSLPDGEQPARTEPAKIPVTLDTAYARQCGYDYTGRESLPGDDVLPTTADIWIEHGFLLSGDHPGQYPSPFVTVQVEGTNVRLDVSPAAARAMARQLEDCADEIDAGMS